MRSINKMFMKNNGFTPYKRLPSKSVVNTEFSKRVKSHYRKQLFTGFTLIEIMLVVIIIAALAAMVVPRFVGRSEQAKVSVARTDLEANLATALKLYELDNGMFPTTNQGLQALRERPAGGPNPANWNGPYVEKDPIDPWGNFYVYLSPGKHRPDYDLYSKGQDDSSDKDDLTNW